MKRTQSTWDQLVKEQNFQAWLEKSYRPNYFKIWASRQLKAHYDKRIEENPASQNTLNRMHISAKQRLEQLEFRPTSWRQAKADWQKNLDEPAL